PVLEYAAEQRAAREEVVVLDANRRGHGNRGRARIAGARGADLVYVVARRGARAGHELPAELRVPGLAGTGDAVPVPVHEASEVRDLQGLDRACLVGQLLAVPYERALERGEAGGQRVGERDVVDRLRRAVAHAQAEADGLPLLDLVAVGNQLEHDVR